MTDHDHEPSMSPSRVSIDDHDVVHQHPLPGSARVLVVAFGLAIGLFGSLVLYEVFVASERRQERAVAVAVEQVMAVVNERTRQRKEADEKLAAEQAQQRQRTRTALCTVLSQHFEPSSAVVDLARQSGCPIQGGPSPKILVPELPGSAVDPSPSPSPSPTPQLFGPGRGPVERSRLPTFRPTPQPQPTPEPPPPEPSPTSSPRPTTLPTPRPSPSLIPVPLPSRLPLCDLAPILCRSKR